MNNCLSESQQYDREYLFWMSVPNKISVSDSLSHMMKVCENLRFAMQRCKFALSSEDINDKSCCFEVHCCRQDYGFIVVLDYIIYTCNGGIHWLKGCMSHCRGWMWSAMVCLLELLLLLFWWEQWHDCDQL